MSEKHKQISDCNVVFLGDQDAPTLVFTCEDCAGTGTILKAHPFPDDPEFCDENRCDECGGSGRVFR